jgi:hypothetical protein
MMLGIDNVILNLGVSFEMVIFIIFILGNLIFFAKSFQIGIIMLLVFSTAGFAWFYYKNYYFVPFLAMMFISFVMLTFTLYFMGKASESGGFN